MAADLIVGPRSADGRRGKPVPPFVVAVRMRWTMLRRSLRDPSTAAWSYLGAAIGLVLAAGTIWIAVVYPKLLAPALGLWLLGWMIGPVITGRGEPLRPEYFAAIGLTSRQLALALLGGSLAGLGPAISLVATFSLIVFGFRSGTAAGLVAIPVMLLTLLVYVSAAKLSTALYVILVRVPVGAAFAGVITGFVLAFTAQGWALVVAFVSPDLAAVLDVVARVIPPGWGVQAIEAAADSAPLPAIGALLGMLALVVILVLGWGWLLGRRTVATAIRVRPRRLLRAHDSGSAARAKDLRSVLRDPLQINRLVFALAYALSFCLMPVAIGWAGMVPWAGPVFVVMATSVSANLYGNDGTGLWQVIMTPDVAGPDVRARQQTFLIMVLPATIVITILSAVFVEAPAQWPYVIAALSALIGAGIGLILVLSVYLATATTDPHKRTADPLDTGAQADATGTLYLAMFAVGIAACPALLAVRLVGWWGVPVGVVTGVLCWHHLTRLAVRRLQQAGPELLNLMRHGRSVADSAEAGRKTSALDALPTVRRRLVGICFLFGAIPLFPQGIVPLAFMITGVQARAWFLAMYLPTPVSWIVAVAMIMLGLAMYTYAAVTYRAATRQSRSVTPRRTAAR